MSTRTHVMLWCVLLVGCGSREPSIDDPVTTVEGAGASDVAPVEHPRVNVSRAESPQRHHSSAELSEQYPPCGRPAHAISHGGAITGSLDILPVLWGPNVASDTVAGIPGFFDVATATGSTWMDVIRSEYIGYSAWHGPSFTVSSAVTITPTVSTGSTVTDAQIQAELNYQIQHDVLPAGSSGTAYMYVVYFPPGVSPLVNFGSFTNVALCEDVLGNWACGYHDTLGGTQSTFAVIPDHTVECATNWCAFPNTPPNSYQAMLVAESHEIAETLTDPDTGAGSGFWDRSGNDPCKGSEIGDMCQSLAESVSNGGGSAWLQAIWSNRANACVTRPGVDGDMNGDGFSDMSLAGGISNGNIWQSMPVAFGNGDGTFRGTNAGITTGNTSFYLSANEENPFLGDFNGDGLTDMAANYPTQSAHAISVAFSNGDGTYQGTNGNDGGFYQYFYQSGVQEVSGDFNGDGRADFALFGPSNWRSIPVAYSNGDGSFTVTNASDGGFYQYASQPGARPVVGDFNCDGLSDIALVGPVHWNTIPIAYASRNLDGSFTTTNGSDGGLHSYYQTGDLYVGMGACPTWIAIVGPTNWTHIPVARSNGDANGTFASVVAYGDGGFHVFYQPNVKAIGGDFDGDGFGDIALTGGSGWQSMPVGYFGTSQFSYTNHGETSGDTGFPTYATAQDALPVWYDLSAEQ